MKKKILITGGTGFLGINLAKKFSKKYTVILSGRNNKLNYIAKNKTQCEVIPLDVSNINSIRDAINYAKPDIIIHAAATKFVDLSEKFPFETIDSNVLGSSNIARVSIDKKIKTVLCLDNQWKFSLKKVLAVLASPIFIKRNFEYWITKDILNLEFKTDCHTFDATRKELPLKYNNLCEPMGELSPIGSRVIENSILGDFLTHHKGTIGPILYSKNLLK